MVEKTQTVIRIEPELKRLAALYSKKIGCNLGAGSFAFFLRIAAREKLLELQPGLRNIRSVDWEEVSRYNTHNL